MRRNENITYLEAVTRAPTEASARATRMILVYVFITANSDISGRETSVVPWSVCRSVDTTDLLVMVIGLCGVQFSL